MLDQKGMRLGAITLYVDSGPRGELARFTYQVDSSDETADLPLQVQVVELGGTSAAPGIDGEAIVAIAQQTFTGDLEWGHHRNFSVGKLARKRVFFNDLRIAPATR